MLNFSTKLTEIIKKAKKYGFDVSYSNNKYVFTIDNLPNQILLKPFTISISKVGNEVDNTEYQILKIELDILDEIEMAKTKTESLRRSALEKLTDEEILALKI